jgi:putative hemolysin
MTIGTAGGFVAPNFQQWAMPSLIVYGNGSVLRQPDERRRPDLTSVQLHVLDPVRLHAMVRAIAVATDTPTGGWGFPGVADVPNTYIRISLGDVRVSISIYALAFTNGGNVNATQAEARRRLQKAITTFDRAVRKAPARSWAPTFHEAWTSTAIASWGAMGMPNPASTFCTSMGGTLSIVDTPAGQVGYCYPLDGTRIEEWAYYRANAPRMGQWPTSVKISHSGCTVVRTATFAAQFRRANPQGLWVTSTGQVIGVAFRPVLPGEHACRRG